MVIQIHCPACPASFPVDPDKIPEAGVKARCSSCGHVFRVERPSSIDDLAPDATSEVATGPEPEVEPESELEPEPEVAAESLPEFDVEPEEEITGDSSTAAPAEPDFSVEAEDGDAADEGPAENSFFSGCAPADTEEAPVQESVSDDAVAVAEDTVPAVEDAAVEEAPAEEAAPKVRGLSFGKRDPTDKAKRLARVIVSVMTIYNADLHESALAKGTLKEDFQEEIEKSWKEYVEQVGADMGEGDGQEFWRQALNDVLAKGEQLF
jgi:predicted Zn finger-like uncharacterized protein